MSDNDNKLFQRIIRFISNKKAINPNTGWAEVTHDEITELYSIIAELVSLKWDSETDRERDIPVEITITDKTKYEVLPYFNIRHFHQLETREEKLDLLQLVKANAKMAFDDLAQMVDWVTREDKLQLRKG